MGSGATAAQAGSRGPSIRISPAERGSGQTASRGGRSGGLMGRGLSAPGGQEKESHDPDCDMVRS